MAKKRQCVVCGYCSRKGVKINNHFICRSCEKEMIGDQEKEQEEREWAEVNRLESLEGFQICTHYLP